MPHACTDWSTNPPVRKTACLVLAHGDRRAYTVIPDDLEALERLARDAFELGDVDVRFHSSCANLCDGLPARITESAWEHIRHAIGCATVEVVARSNAKRRLSDEGSATEQDTLGHHEDADAEGPPRKQRRVASESEEEPNEPSSPVIKKEKTNDAHPEPDALPARPVDDADRPIKQEKLRARTASHSEPPHAESQETRSQATAESNDVYKVMIRVAHRPSGQESKFTSKNTTKVNKVLAGACKSFKLDPDKATMYLIVMMEDEEGLVENLFPCDRNDTIARAGAERDSESRFLLKMAGEDVM